MPPESSPTQTSAPSAPPTDDVSIQSAPDEIAPPPVSKPKTGESAWDEIERMAAPDKEKKSGTSKQTKPAQSQRKSAPQKAEQQESSSESAADTAQPAEDSSAGKSGDGEGAKVSEQETSSPGKTPASAPELRKAYERVKSELKALRTEHEKLKTTKPAEDAEKPKLVEGLQSAHKRIAELEEELRYAAYERSDEYQQKYETPFIEAYQTGRERAKQLVITTEDGATRQATEGDFDAIMAIANEQQAVKLAHELFGQGAASVLYDRAHVQHLNRLRAAAVQDFRKKGAERERLHASEISARQETARAEQSKLSERFNRLNREAIDKYPEFFKADETDSDGARLLEKGFAMADKAFAGPYSGLSKEQKVELDSAIRNKAGAFDFIVHKNRQLKQRIAELEADLAAFKESQPGADSGAPSKALKTLSFEEEIDRIASGRR